MLDFFVVCDLVLPHITRMVIDDNKNHILRISKLLEMEGKAVDSDHLTVIEAIDKSISDTEAFDNIETIIKNFKAGKLVSIPGALTNFLPENTRTGLENDLSGQILRKKSLF